MNRTSPVAADTYNEYALKYSYMSASGFWRRTTLLADGLNLDPAALRLEAVHVLHGTRAVAVLMSLNKEME